MFEIGDILISKVQYHGIVGIVPGTKAEVVGKGRDTMWYIRLLYSGVLIELNEEWNNWEKEEGTKIVK